MLLGYKICIVMPAYNAEKTLKQTFKDLPLNIIDRVIVVDDYSTDMTLKVSKDLKVDTFLHIKNMGYGANQKTCYTEALKGDEDIVVMVHPDYQYSPKLVTAMAAMIASQEYDVVLASRILGKGALKGGMPMYKYIANRFLTLIENLLLDDKLSEYHSGYRAFHRKVLEKLPLAENSNDFVFDNQMLAQIIIAKYRIGEISCPTKYFKEASSINFFKSCIYGIGVLWCGFLGFLARKKIFKAKIFNEFGRRLLGATQYKEIKKYSSKKQKNDLNTTNCIKAGNKVF